MTNDTAVSPAHALLALAIVAMCCVPVMAVTVSFENKTYGIYIEKEAQVINGSYYVDISDIPHTNPRVTYPQEYYTLGQSVDAQLDKMTNAYAYGSGAVISEMRRQTILMEKQNELLAEQNELMGRLVNATENKYSSKISGFYIDPNKFNTSNYEYDMGEYK